MDDVLKRLRELEKENERQRLRDRFAAEFGQQMPLWIPVSERLPEDDQHVVAWDSQNKIAVVAYRFGESSWCMNAGDQYGFDAHAVTHWMGLPEPPTRAT